MKKAVLSLSCILFITLNAFCQETGFGIRAGYNYTTSSISEIFSGKDTMPAPDPSGFSGAVFLDLGITKSFSLDINFSFNENETDLMIDSLPDGKRKETGTVTSQYELPLLGKLKFGSQVLKFSLMAGPNFSFQRKKFTEERIYGIEPNDVTTERTDLPTSDLKSFEYRNIIGFGLSFHLNRFVIFGDYRHAFKFNNLDAARLSGLTENLGANVGVGVGYYW